MGVFLFIAGCCLGIIIGMVIIFLITKMDGTLKINTYDPDKDVYSFEFTTPLNEITRKNKLHFKVEIVSKPESH